MWRGRNSLLKGRSFHQNRHQISALKGWSNWKREKMNTKAQRDDKQQRNILTATQQVSGAKHQEYAGPVSEISFCGNLYYSRRKAQR